MRSSYRRSAACLAHGMMQASIEGYERYFAENPKAKPGKIDNLAGRIAALKSEFYEPQVPEPEPVA